MALFSGGMDPLPRRSLLERTGLILLTLIISFGVSWTWSLHEARMTLSGAGRAIQPLLSSLYPDLDTAQLLGYSPGFRLSILTGEGETVLSEGPVQDETLSLPSLNNPGETFRQAGRLYYLFPLHEPGEPQANAILSLPVRQLWPKTLWKTIFLLALLTLYRIYRLRRQARASMPRRQLLEEVESLRADSIDRKLRLPLETPYKPVADLINQLLTTRERKDRQLNEQHHQQQVLLNNMSEGILTLDNDQRITGLNPSAARWLNLGNAQRVQGELFYTVCRNPKLLQMIEAVSGSSLQEEYLRLERMGMEDRIVKVKGSPLIDQDQTMGVLLVLQDVTTLRRLETLRQDFVSNVTHELRTPLTAIKGYAELLVDDPEVSDETRGYLERVLKQSTRMINIIEDLLSLTRIEDSEDSPSLAPTEIHPLLESVLQLCEEQSRLRDLTLTLDCAEDLAADLHPALFEQAIHNLVYNAVKYTHPGTEIRIQASEANNQIRIEIQDEGPGIPEEDQARIFERFYRVDKARSRAVGGTGLGLSIVKHIILMHQGNVGVTSKPGKGTTFWIELPQRSI
jgi:two-component system phosphate regulon sensor histidine kinase PhoR